jgi:pyrroline-5-carboxylate reductase
MEVDAVKRIGIIGVGEIGRAIVTGLCDGGDKSLEVFLPLEERARSRSCPSASRACGCASTISR